MIICRLVPTLLSDVPLTLKNPTFLDCGHSGCDYLDSFFLWFHDHPIFSRVSRSKPRVLATKLSPSFVARDVDPRLGADHGSDSRYILHITGCNCFSLLSRNFHQVDRLFIFHPMLLLAFTLYTLFLWFLAEQSIYTYIWRNSANAEKCVSGIAGFW